MLSVRFEQACMNQSAWLEGGWTSDWFLKMSHLSIQEDKRTPQTYNVSTIGIPNQRCMQSLLINRSTGQINTWMWWCGGIKNQGINRVSMTHFLCASVLQARDMPDFNERVDEHFTFSETETTRSSYVALPEINSWIINFLIINQNAIALYSGWFGLFFINTNWLYKVLDQ